MQFIPGSNRRQSYFSTLQDQVGADNAVRLIDAFIVKLDLYQLGFTNTVPKSEGFLELMPCNSAPLLAAICLV